MTPTLPTPGFRALILEDHDFQRFVGAQVLKNCGSIEVLEAGDGVEALALVATLPEEIDIFLCDLNMPGMDGLAFLRHIGERRSRSSVILASALDPSILRAAEIMARNYGLRILGVVEKPISRDKLMPLILRHFSQGLILPKPNLPLMSAAEIAGGIARREFGPYFQPKVGMRSCALVGVEALMRWHHPALGTIMPGAFIPVMEVKNLISDVTFQLVEMSLAHCRRWRDAGLNVPIAVNISVDSLSDLDLPDRLEAMTRAAGLTAASLMLEVTETVAMTDLRHSLETLARVRMKGFSVSIDDYGTGFSSMQQLSRLPASELKIDQSFVTGASKEDVLSTLIEASVGIARRLKLKTVAEGVESSDDWDLVARLGCDAAQGFFIAEPMPGEELASWYTDWLGKQSATKPRSQTTEERS